MDLSKLIINVPQNSKPTLMRAISYMWIITGVILLLVGIWASAIYYLVAPLREKLIQTAAEYPSNSAVLSMLNALPFASAILITIAIACGIAGFHFKLFKPWALGGIHLLSYLMLFVSGVLGFVWVKLWMFTIEYSQGNNWNYVGMFVGVFAIVVYVGIMIYFIRSIRNKKFREAYHNKIPL